MRAMRTFYICLVLGVALTSAAPSAVRRQPSRPSLANDLDGNQAAFVARHARTAGARGEAREHEAMLAGSSILAQDFSRMAEPHFLGFDGELGIEANTNKTFAHFVASAHLPREMTGEEIELFRERVVDEIAVEAARDHVAETIGTQREALWNKVVRQAVEDQKPALTQRMVEIIAPDALEEDLEGHVTLPQSLKNFSALDFKMITGSIEEDDESNPPSLMEDDFDPESQAKAALIHAGFPTEMDARTKWPECANVIGHIREQGMCGSCWAQAVAGALEGRFCILTNGGFSGDSAWMSAGYITSCFDQAFNPAAPNGCKGGSVLYALQQFQEMGVPTGGKMTSTTTCSPYFTAKNSLEHFDTTQTMLAPQCPTSCTSSYPRTLQQDSFLGQGPPTKTSAWSVAKAALYNGGPIIVRYKVFADLLLHKGKLAADVYAPSKDSMNHAQGSHATTLIGYGQTADGEHLLSLNSWGTDWGESGTFRMKAACCGNSKVKFIRDFVIPGDIPSAQVALPLPGVSGKPEPEPAPTTTTAAGKPTPKPKPSPTAVAAQKAAKKAAQDLKKATAKAKQMANKLKAATAKAVKAAKATKAADKAKADKETKLEAAKQKVEAAKAKGATAVAKAEAAVDKAVAALAKAVAKAKKAEVAEESAAKKEAQAVKDDEKAAKVLANATEEAEKAAKEAEKYATNAATSAALEEAVPSLTKTDTIHEEMGVMDGEEAEAEDEEGEKDEYDEEDDMEEMNK